MVRILFVCLGNICRSPLAEAIFKHKIAESGLSGKFIVDSSGTGDYHIGEDPDARTIEVAIRNGVSISHKARQFSTRDFDSFDYIIAMDESNLRNIRNLKNNIEKGRLMLMRDFDESKDKNVPDPYFGGKDGFDEVFDILDASLANFLEFLKKEHQF